MVGQEAICKKMECLTFANFTCPILFVGDVGCGKKTLAKSVSDRLGIDMVVVADDFSREDIIEYMQSPVKTLYYIDLQKFNERQQNQFLKFVEEPSKNVYIILGASSELSVLDTILNRCHKYKFCDYTKEELQSITGVSSDLVLSTFKTPGQILNNSEDKLVELIKFCKFLAQNFDRLSTPNLIALSQKINFKDDYKKFDFFSFFVVYINVLFNEYLSTKDMKFYRMYVFTNQFLERLNLGNLSKANFMTDYLLTLKEMV